MEGSDDAASVVLGELEDLLSDAERDELVSMSSVEADRERLVSALLSNFHPRPTHNEGRDVARTLLRSARRQDSRRWTEEEERFLCANANLGTSELHARMQRLAVTDSEAFRPRTLFATVKKLSRVRARARDESVEKK